MKCVPNPMPNGPKLMKTSSIFDSALRLLIAGVPSLVGLVVGTVFLFPPDRSIPVALLIIGLSSVLFLVGVNQTSRPLYLLVPAMIPVGLLISPNGKAIPGLLVGALMLVTASVVRGIYSGSFASNPEQSRQSDLGEPK